MLFCPFKIYRIRLHLVSKDKTYILVVRTKRLGINNQIVQFLTEIYTSTHSRVSVLATYAVHTKSIFKIVLNLSPFFNRHENISSWLEIVIDFLSSILNPWSLQKITDLSFVFIKNEPQLHFSILPENTPQPLPLRIVYRDGILSVSIIYCTTVSHTNVLILFWHFDLVSFLPCLLPSLWVNGSCYAIYPNEKAITSIAMSEYRASNIVCH